jgi:hypothetical protein
MELSFNEKYVKKSCSHAVLQSCSFLVITLELFDTIQISILAH